ncbi:MAG: trypsin-like peptidase domain-containing protein [Spirochaetota bacterium]|nr:trypsin-like peptidase domain-containing protein [Spirochaetota bacterium]
MNHTIIESFLKKKYLAHVFVLLLLCINYNIYGQNNFNTQQSPIKNNKDTSNAVMVQDAFRKIYELYNERVVSILTEQTVQIQLSPLYQFFFGGGNQGQFSEKRIGLGSGFILTKDGYIGTNHHIIDGVDKIEVMVNSNTYSAVIIGSDERTDIALLKIKPKEKLKPVFFGTSECMVGDWAIAIGNPFGLDKTFTVGVISAVGRKDVDLMGYPQSHIQTDASINPGNSGGPLINIDGEVIGINKMIISESGGSVGIGFAFPIDDALQILDQLKIHKKIIRGYIGVQLLPITDDYAEEAGLRSVTGAVVIDVEKKSPADKGGVKTGDIILGINNNKIDDLQSLIESIEKKAIGEVVNIEVWRKNKRIKLKIKIAERP